MDEFGVKSYRLSGRQWSKRKPANMTESKKVTYRYLLVAGMDSF